MANRRVYALKLKADNFVAPTAGSRTGAWPRVSSVRVERAGQTYHLKWLETRSVRTMGASGPSTVEVTSERQGDAVLYTQSGVLICSGFGRSVKRLLEFLWPDSKSRPGIVPFSLRLDHVLRQDGLLRGARVEDLFVDSVGPGSFMVGETKTSALQGLMAGTRAWLSQVSLEVPSRDEDDGSALLIERSGSAVCTGPLASEDWSDLVAQVRETFKAYALWDQVAHGG